MIPKWLVDSASIVGSIATAIGVLFALWVSGRDEQRRQRADHRDQASRVSVHVERSSARSGTTGPFFTASVIAIINASSSPIYEVVVGGGRQKDGDSGLLQGNDNNRLLYVVPPGRWLMDHPKGLQPDDRTYEDDGEGSRRMVDPGTPRGPTITFRDGNGVTWARNARGVLQEVTGAPTTVREMTEPFPLGGFRPADST